jgi:hypothetical protein
MGAAAGGEADDDHDRQRELPHNRHISPPALVFAATSRDRRPCFTKTYTA